MSLDDDSRNGARALRNEGAPIEPFLAALGEAALARVVAAIVARSTEAELVELARAALRRLERPAAIGTVWVAAQQRHEELVPPPPAGPAPIEGDLIPDPRGPAWPGA